MTLHPAADSAAKYHPPPARAFEVPVLQTSPVGRYPPQALGTPSYAGYTDDRRDYNEIRPETQLGDTRRLYSSHPVPTRYNPATPDESQYRQPYVNHEHNAGAPHTPTGNDNRGSYIGVRDFPNEGSFYVYEGGQRIPTHVDGEQVNPAWGLTKANKPRKRLALACLDCREKKIKCEPAGVSTCLQCEKARRVCRRYVCPAAVFDASNTLSRSQAQMSQADASTGSWPSAAGSPTKKGASTSDPTPTQSRDIEPDPLNKRRTRENSSPPTVPTKKHRSASPMRTSPDPSHAPREATFVPRPQSPAAAVSYASKHRQTNMDFDWENDPFSVDPGLTLHLLNVYFAHVNNATYCLYPRSHFLHWAQHSSDKCQNERMMLYGMLAAATIFADDNDLSRLGKQFANIAKDAVATQTGKYNVASTHTHILLSLYHFAKGLHDMATTHFGVALHSVQHQNFNTEQGCRDDSSSMLNPRIEFALSRKQLAECKRRTFWSMVFMDRTRGSTTCAIKPEDMFVRLPCTDDMYERSITSDAPYYSNGIIDPSESIITASSPIAPMAWLTIVAVLWGNVLDFTFRGLYRGATGYDAAYKHFYDDTNHGLQGWRTRLPQHLQYSEQNLELSIQQGYAGTFIAMHAMYHMAQIKMNRYVHHALVPDIVPKNLKAANESARELLRQMGALRSARRSIATPAEGQPTTFALSTPFPGYATLAAIDITSAGGWELSLSSTINEIFDGLSCLQELSRYWIPAKEQLRACEKRYYQIQNILQRRTSHEGAWMGRKWGMDKPLEQEFNDAKYDCVWGLGNGSEVYFETLKNDDSNARAQPGGLRLV